MIIKQFTILDFFPICSDCIVNVLHCKCFVCFKDFLNGRLFASFGICLLLFTGHFEDGFFTELPVSFLVSFMDFSKAVAAPPSHSPRSIATSTGFCGARRATLIEMKWVSSICVLGICFWLFSCKFEWLSSQLQQLLQLQLQHLLQQLRNCCRRAAAAAKKKESKINKPTSGA